MQHSKSKLIKAAASGLCSTEIAAEIIDRFLTDIKTVVSVGDTVKLAGFATLHGMRSKESKRRNPNTGESVIAPAGNLRLKVVKSKQWV